MSRASSDVREYTMALGKATEPNAILDILKLLSALPASTFTLALLKSTKCGKVVSTLKKKTTNDDVKTLASALLKTMKKAASSQGYSKPSTSKSTTVIPLTTVAAATTTTTTTTTSSTASTASTASSAASTAPTISLTTTGSVPRDRVQQKLFGILKKLPATSAEETAKVPATEAIGKIAVALEDCMNRQASLDKRPRDYMSLVKRLTFNLQQNDELRGQVARGEIPAYALVEMKPEELATKDIKQMRQGLVVVYKTKQEQRMETSIQAGVKNAGISMYTCPKCESRNCDSFAMQTRGADEPMTIFCTCLDCGQAFRGGNDQAGHD